MSPRAAWRLEGIGFDKVYDYVPGKADWSASGFPTEGKLASVPTVGDVARQDTPTCTPAEKVGHVRQRIKDAGWDRCVVVNSEQVVLGQLREKELSSDPDAPVEMTMRNGPTTFRPNEPVGKLVKRMRERNVSAVLVTTSDGKLVGLLSQDDAEQAAH
jgi:CBS domain-containing protein